LAEAAHNCSKVVTTWPPYWGMMSIESLTYADLAGRLGTSREAARSLDSTFRPVVRPYGRRLCGRDHRTNSGLLQLVRWVTAKSFIQHAFGPMD
jgi:hypothetical protein